MYLSLKSQFRPFTYDEMVKPLVQYKEAYDKVEQDYSDLTAQTEMWKNIVNQTNSPEAYEMYQRYSNDLAAITDSFSRGMNINNRSALLGMKRRYAQDITPIATADAAMKAANELRVKAGPDAIFEVGEYNSLDQFLHGKTANNNYTSREALTKKTMAMTEAAMAEALQDPEFKKYMGDQFWLITQHTGGSYADLIAAINNNPKAQNRFAEIKQKVMADAGIDRYDSRGRMAIEDAVNTGLYAGLDKPVKSFQANQDHMNPLQQAQIAASNASAEHTRMSTRLLRAQVNNLEKGLTKDGKDPSGSSSKERKTVSSNAFMIDLKNPNNSKPISTTEGKKDIQGSKITLNDFKDVSFYYKKDPSTKYTDRYSKFDDKTIKATKDKARLSTLILRYTGESSLEEALDKYDIYLNEDKNLLSSNDYQLTFTPRDPKLYGRSSELLNMSDLINSSFGGSSSGFDMNFIPDE